jgi:ribosomal protein S6--L-glutamate ligase
LAVAAAAAVTADYCGVDLIDDGAGGFAVLEVNSMPAWSGLQTVTETGVARAVAAGFLAAVRAKR